MVVLLFKLIDELFEWWIEYLFRTKTFSFELNSIIQIIWHNDIVNDTINKSGYKQHYCGDLLMQSKQTLIFISILKAIQIMISMW